MRTGWARRGAGHARPPASASSLPGTCLSCGWRLDSRHRQPGGSRCLPVNLEAVLPHNRYKTAISRIDYSRPIRTALADGLITPGVTVLDFGCGLGDDVRHLGLKGIEAWGWDPAHRPDGDLVPAEVVNLGYVVNVIEDIGERAQCLSRAWSFAGKALIVSARLASEAPDFTSVAPYADGHVTSILTFQKLYEQAGLKDWLEHHLNAPAVAAAPGVFYVFRSTADRIGFLASRHRRRGIRVSASVQNTIEAYRDLLRPLIEFFEERGRPPAEDELADAAAIPIRERFGSVRRAFTLVRRGHDSDDWTRITTARGEDLLIFLALSRFDGRPRFGQLPRPARLDIQSIFSTYRNACEQADVALLAAGDMQRVLMAARRSAVGKLTPLRAVCSRERPGKDSSPAPALRRLRSRLHRTGGRSEHHQAAHGRTQNFLPRLPRLRIRPPPRPCRVLDRAPANLSAAGARLPRLPESAHPASKGDLPGSGPPTSREVHAAHETGGIQGAL